MNKWKIFPGIIILIQLISLGHLYYTYQYENSEIPATFIELNIFAGINIIMLVLSYFFYFKADKKHILWWGPISVSVIIVFTLICYITMGIDKYR